MIKSYLTEANGLPEHGSTTLSRQNGNAGRNSPILN